MSSAELDELNSLLADPEPVVGKQEPPTHIFTLYFLIDRIFKYLIFSRLLVVGEWYRNAFLRATLLLLGHSLFSSYRWMM